ncbi:FlgB family protein [Tropicimonas isoalkanivorans]|uniref:Flagellar basal-body rod protein FlgB n=1 Tax=Tropicimonas isoalkanivorans TaxID=441112 RepID=A0A1I1PW11_9RHOB|nr:FlgB family protein [Tropicimonas isoalkanivorans]SFD10090.1 flagellar basal-body rod protein FlgB [Tropicimonas isoalkanivorans]
MFQNLEIFRLAQGMAEHAASRQSVVAGNIANADTPGYRQRDIPDFAEIWRNDTSGIGMRRTRDSHLSQAPGSERARSFAVSDAPADPNGNTVSLETEIIKSAEIRQQHEIALSIYRSGLSVLRTSLGRR